MTESYKSGRLLFKFLETKHIEREFHDGVSSLSQCPREKETITWHVWASSQRAANTYAFSRHRNRVKDGPGWKSEVARRYHITEWGLRRHFQWWRSTWEWLIFLLALFISSWGSLDITNQHVMPLLIAGPDPIELIGAVLYSWREVHRESSFTNSSNLRFSLTFGAVLAWRWWDCNKCFVRTKSFTHNH